MAPRETDGGFDTSAGAGYGTGPSTAPRSIPDLIGDLIRDLSGLVQSEGRLLRAEVNEAGKKMAVGAEMIAAGGILLLVALIVLTQALVIAIAHLVGPGWASVIVGAALALIGALLITRGRKSLSTASLVPERTMEQTSRDARLAKEQL